MMQFWQPPKHSIAGYKVVSQRLQQIFGENAPIALSFVELFLERCSEGIEEKNAAFVSLNFLFNQESDFLYARVSHNSRILNFLLDLQSLFALVVSRIRR